MYFHCAGYVEAIASSTNTDIDAVQDDVLQRRNSHLIMSEPFNLIAACNIGANTTRVRFGNIALTFRGTNHLWPINRSAIVPSRPGVYDRLDDPLRLPLNEEITIETTTDGPAMGSAQVATVLWLAKPSWTRNLPRGLERLKTRATAVVAVGTETTWTALSALTF